MLIYEKENKLNINFDNEVSEQPDLQISKEDGKTQILINGQQEDRGPLILEFATENPYTVTTPIADIKAAIDAGRQVYFYYHNTIMPFVGYYIENNELFSMNFAAPSFDDGGLIGVSSVYYSKLDDWVYYQM